MKTIGIIAVLVGLFVMYQGFSSRRCQRQSFYTPYAQQPPMVIPVSQPRYYQPQPHAFGGEFNVSW